MKRISRMAPLILILMLVLMNITHVYGEYQVAQNDQLVQVPALTCPADTQQIDIVTTQQVLTKQYNTTFETTLTLPADSPDGVLLVQSMVGHPEAGCPDSGSRLCEDQDNESFSILVDGQQIGNVPDHGNDQWQTFAFPLDLSAGSYDLTFAHVLLDGNSIYSSVEFTAVYCAADLANDPDPTPTPDPDDPDNGDDDDVPPSAVPLCADLDGSSSDVVRADVPAGVFGLHCRVIIANGSATPGSSFGEIGDAAIIALGIRQAVDVFTLGDGSAAGTNLCLLGTGDIVFLDAAASPRFAQFLPSTRDDGYTCAVLPNDGIVVLVDLPPIAFDESGEAAAPAVTELDNCQVTTTAMLNLRAEPSTSAEVVELVPYDLTLTATATANGWYRVIYLDGQGWLSADYLTLSAGCSG